MALRKFKRRNYGGKQPVIMKYQNTYSFKEGLILLCQSILETRRITYLHGSVHCTIPLTTVIWERNQVHLGENSFVIMISEFYCYLSSKRIFNWFSVIAFIFGSLQLLQGSLNLTFVGRHFDNKNDYHFFFFFYNFPSN